MVEADLVVMNGDIWTMDIHGTRAEALAIKDGVIQYVGSDRGVRDYIGGGTRVIDAEGRSIIPGIIDSHIHLLSLGISMNYLDLRDVSSIEDIRRLIRERARELGEGRWIIGRGWDQERLIEGRYPNRLDIDDVSGNNPVLLIRVCGHIALANTIALRMAGIDRYTSDPEGGIIDRDEDGEPTGILREEAIRLVRDIIPEPTQEEYIDAAIKAIDECIRHGITTVHIVSALPADISTILRLREMGRLRVRVRFYIDHRFLDGMASLGIRGGLGDDWVRINGVKIFVDGSLGGRTAALREPYSDDPGNMGKLVLKYGELLNTVRLASEHGFQPAIHGIGDRAIETILRAFIEIYNSGGILRRPRIEHASIMPPDLVGMMSRLGVSAAVQPRFILSDFWIVERLGGDRARYAYNFKTLMRNNITIGGGSDAPVEPINPFHGIYASITRGEPDGAALASYTLDESLSLEDALKLYTINSAYLGMDEDRLGSIEVGKLGDIVILDGELDNIKPEKIKEIKVWMTIIGGEIVYHP